MPSPQSGTACNLVPPASPTAALDADDATAGSKDSIAAAGSSDQSGGGSSSQNPSNAPAHKPDPTKPHWIEIVLVDEQNNPVPGEAYAITLPDGQTVASGTLDGKGFARVDGIANPGSCIVTFPNLDKTAWKPA